MNEMTEQAESSHTPDPLSVNNEEEKIFAPQNELPFPEQEIDLNHLFPNEETDLNDLFPDEETRQLLKKVQRNKKDLHTMTDRFTEEDWSGAEPSGEHDKEPEPKKDEHPEVSRLAEPQETTAPSSTED
jgi:hypothetical protein